MDNAGLINVQWGEAMLKVHVWHVHFGLSTMLGIGLVQEEEDFQGSLHMCSKPIPAMAWEGL